MADAPGSGALNAGYAVTYGDLGETNRMNLVNLLDRQNEERQQRLQAKQQADAAHKFALQKYYGKEFDPNNFDTQTDLNKAINEELLKGKKNLSEIINNPNSSDEDIDSAAQQALTPAMKLYQIGTAVKRNIDGSVEGLKGDKSLDVGSLQKQAYVNALYTRDPQTGKLRLKNDQELSQIDPEHNYAADILQNHPELVAKGDVDYNGFLKTLPVANQKLTGEWYSSPGVKHKSAFDASWYDGAQKLVQDHKGAYHIETANEPIETTDANGNPIKINQIPQSVINTMQSTPGAKAKLDVATMQYLAQHSPNVSVEPGTPAFETAKKAMVYEMLDKNAPKRISQGEGVNKSASLIRLELGYPLPQEKTKITNDDIADVNKSFNNISGVKYYKESGVGVVPMGNITNGKADGQVQNGEVLMKLEDLPIAIRNAVAKYSPGNDVSGITTGTRKKPTGLLQVELKDGVVSGVMTDKGQWFRATDLTNANIKEQNSTLPMKQKQHFIQGNPQKKDPLGLF